MSEPRTDPTSEPATLTEPAPKPVTRNDKLLVVALMLGTILLALGPALYLSHFHHLVAVLYKVFVAWGVVLFVVSFVMHARRGFKEFRWFFTRNGLLALAGAVVLGALLSFAARRTNADPEAALQVLMLLVLVMAVISIPVSFGLRRWVTARAASDQEKDSGRS